MIFDQLKSVVSYTSAAIFTLEKNELVIVEYEAPVPQRPPQPLRLSLEQSGLGQEVIRCREPVIVDDVKGDIPLARALQNQTDTDVTATLLCSLVDGDPAHRQRQGHWKDHSVRSRRR